MLPEKIQGEILRRREDAFKIIERAGEAGIDSVSVGERQIPLEEIKNGIMREGTFPYAHFIKKIEEAVQKQEDARGIIGRAKDVGIEGIVIGNCGIPLEEIEEGVMGNVHAYQDAVHKLEITLRKSEEALRIIERARKTGAESIHSGERQVPVDEMVESIRKGEVFAQRHILRRIGNAFRRAHRITEKVMGGAGIEEIKYCGKKLPLTKKSLARFLIEYGPEHAKGIRKQIVKVVKERWRSLPR